MNASLTPNSQLLSRPVKECSALNLDIGAERELVHGNARAGLAFVSMREHKGHFSACRELTGFGSKVKNSS